MWVCAADFVNPKDLPEGKTIVDYLIEETDGGLDFTFDATGNVGVMRNALEACHKGWGVCNIIGVAPQVPKSLLDRKLFPHNFPHTID